MTATPLAAAPSLLPDDQPDRKGRRIGFANLKGGVGKTATTLEMASALARRGRRVLMVDLEPQGNLTRRAAVADVEHAITLGELLRVKEKGGAAAGIYSCGWDVPEAALIDVIPADLSLNDRDAEAAMPGSFNRLARILYGVTDAYDYTLFDSRPALGHLEQMLVRSLDGPEDGYYLVVEAEADAISGAYSVRHQFDQWAHDMDVEPQALGVIVNGYDGRTLLHRGSAEHLAESLTPEGGTPPPVLRPFIRQAARIAEIHHFALSSTGDQRLKNEGHLDRFDALAEQIDQ